MRSGARHFQPGCLCNTPPRDRRAVVSGFGLAGARSRRRQHSQILVCHGLAVEVVELKLLPVLVAVDQQQADAALGTAVEDRLGYLLARREDWRVDVQRTHDGGSVL